MEGIKLKKSRIRITWRPVGSENYPEMSATNPELKKALDTSNIGDFDLNDHDDMLFFVGIKAKKKDILKMEWI